MLHPFRKSSFLFARHFAVSFTFSISLALLSLVSSTNAQDPGVRDTVRIEADSLVVGQSRPVRMIVSNDDQILNVTIPLCLTTLDSGFAFFDSVVFVNRMADPSVLDSRVVFRREVDGNSPDSVQLASYQVGGNTLGPGNSAIAEIYFTGLIPGMMKIDTGQFWLVGGANSVQAVLVISWPSGAYTLATPVFLTQNISIVEGVTLPNAVLNESELRAKAGTDVSISINAYSPVGYPVSVTLLDFADFDNPSTDPVNVPSLNVVSEGTFQFSWSSTSADIGIWRAVFNICDSTGNCINKEAIIQIVENDSFLVDFAVTQSPEPFTFATSVGLGNFDSDAHPEIASTGLAWNATPSFALYDDVGSGVFSEVFAADIYFPRRGLQIGYLDNDENLDLIHFRHPGTVEILVYHGDGDNGFALPDTSFLSSTNWSLTAALGNYNDDEFLDYALAGLSYVRILAGSSASDFTIQSEINVGDSIMSIVSKDLNNDGYDDLVIGHRGGIKVYLGSSTGDLTYLTSYTQTFGSVNIEVTNEGADFNGDNYFDLCVATPSVGNVSSQLVVYLGNGDGTFVKRITREVMGHVVANAPGDLNNDGLVDIAYLNSSRKHLGILYGDGDGYFTNELRYSVATLDPARLVCSDFDLDGDIDAMVNTSRFQQGSYLLLYENQTDPGSYMSMSAEFSGEDNAQLELISPTNRVLNRLGSSIPASSYYRRNLNLNDKMDDFTKLNLVESGDYILNVKPDPSQPAGTPFTVEFTADGQKYRLAKDAVMAAGTYEFAVTFQGGSGIAPRSGGFVHINPPVFNWPAKANVDFQLAADIDFTNVLVNETIASSSYQPASPLAVLDTTTYYWRFRPAGSGEFSPIYALNMLPSSPSCGDVDGNPGPINILDLNYLVNRIFRGGTAPPNFENADLNNDGRINIIDLNQLVNYIFRGGPPPVC